MTQITFTLNTPLVNPLNGSHGHWSKRARWARLRREAGAMAILAVVGPHPKILARTPKTITFTAFVGAPWDDDNLRAAIKPYRDSLKDAGLIDDDAPGRHAFVYEQCVERGKGKPRGLRVTVALSELVPAGGRA